MQISKNFDRGRKIKDVNEIYTIAIAKGSVYHPVWGLRAARAICNQQFWTLKKEILKGRLFRTVKRT